MPRDLLPDEVTRVLSVHGPVRLTVGRGGDGASAVVSCAPFDDCLFLFLRPGSGVEKKLLEDCTAELSGQAKDGAYSLRLKGRAVAGPSVMAHPRRLEMLPWLPKGANPRSTVATPFWAEEVNYQRGEGPGAETFHGRTAAGQNLPGLGLRWYRSAFEGNEALAVVGLLGVWMYAVVVMDGTPLRLLAMVVSGLAAVMLMAAGRLWYRATVFDAARRDRGHWGQTPMLSEGLLAPVAVRQVSLFCLLGGLALLLFAGLWGWGLVGVTFGCSFAWFLWPYLVTRLFRGEGD